MVELELECRPDLEVEVVMLSNELGLTASLSSLRSYPGSLHWHLKKPGCRGVIELTYAPGRNRFWLSVRENRAAEWQSECIHRIVLRLGPSDRR